jgi:hypothetical protein
MDLQKRFDAEEEKGMLTLKQLEEFELFCFESRLREDEAKIAFEKRLGKKVSWAEPPSKEAGAYGDPRDRKFTQFAAKAIGGHNALNARRCPTCSNEIGEFRNTLSAKEFSISGMCQACQDSVFGVD